MGEHKYDGPRGNDHGGIYKQLDWAHNCVLQAMSKVLHCSTGTIAQELVPDVIEKISLLENPSVIKVALEHYQMTPLIAGGAAWKTIKHQLNGNEGEYLGIWWGRDGTAEDWSDFSRTSCHAFSIHCSSSRACLPQTNLKDFDNMRPTEDEWISVWLSPESKSDSRYVKYTKLSPMGLTLKGRDRVVILG